MLQNERITTPIWKKILYFILMVVLFAVQVTVYYYAIVGSFAGSQVLYIAGNCLFIIAAIFILNSDSSISYKMTWIVLIAILPYFFTFLYVANYNAKYLPRRKRRKLIALAKSRISINYSEYEGEDNYTKKISKLVYNDDLFPLYDRTNVKFFEDASLKHKDMLEKMKQAEKYVFLEYFILSEGYLLEELLEVLTELGNKGVEIKIIYDDIGSKRALSNKIMKKFVSIPNLKIAVYGPLGLNINPAVNYRDHRKICVIDGKYSYCGGDNLADEYIHKKDRFGYWRDNAVLLDGRATRTFVTMFIDMWYSSTKEKLNITDYLYDYESETDGYILPFGDGPYTDSHTAYDVFKSLIQEANKTLYISTPYLIIDDEMINAIALQAKCGVDVRILVPKIPDKKTVFMMTRAHYYKLLKSGVKIYEFTPGFNHAKNIIVDDKYAFCGTINMDYRSLFLHFECGVVLLENSEIKKMSTDFIDTIDKSENYTIEDWNKRNIFSKILAFLLRLFAPML